MRYISLFSGIEAASCAWKPLGWEPVAFSEIDPFPQAVLAHHYPNVPDLGDITKIDWSEYVGSADVVVGGSPCQSFSVAGSRTGLAGASGLMWEYVRAVRELRTEWFVWENVPGALSSSHGEDFRCLLESMDDLGYGLAWRVLDAQFFGVAQRRRRVFLVGHLGDQRAAEVLFEPESLRRDYPSSREKRKALTRGDACRVGESGERCIWEIAGNIIGRQERNGGHHLGVVDPDESGAFTLTATDRHAVAFAQNQRDEVRDLHDCAGALAAQPGIKQQTFVCTTNGEDMFPSLCATDGSKQFIDNQSVDGGRLLFSYEVAGASYVSLPKTLQIRAGKAGGGKGALVQDDMRATLTCGVQQTLFPGNGSVRRLTPVECERLQGFKDGYTDVPYRGKPHAPDSARYKALGNSMAVPVMQWIGRRIKEASS